MSDDDRFLRQSDLLNPMLAREAKVAIIGCGSLGSHVAVGIARLGVGTIFLYDDDIVEEVNLPAQHFFASDVGQKKCEAVHKHITEIDQSIVVVSTPERYLGGPISPIIVVAVDSIAGRKEIWEALRPQWDNVDMMVDGRMAGFVGRVLTTFMKYPESRRRYAQTIRGEAFHAPCTGRTVWPTVVTTSAFMVEAVRAQVSGEPTITDVMVDMKNGIMVPGVVDPKEVAEEAPTVVARPLEAR